MAHVRISTEQLTEILDEVKRGIDQNLVYVGDDNYAEASGYARGTLFGVKYVLEEVLEHQCWEDDYSPLC